MPPLNIKVRITQIDDFAFQGRDPHPTPDMVGLTATVLAIRTIDIFGDEIRDPFNLVATPMDESMTLYDVITRDGRVTTLCDWEIEPWSLSDEPLPRNSLTSAHARAHYYAQLHYKLPVPARVIPIR